MPHRSDIVARAVERIDKLPVIALLLINAFVAGFVFVAHGGALAVAYFADHGRLAEIFRTAVVSLPLSAAIIVGSLAGLALTRSRHLILSGQCLVLLAGSLVAFSWAASLLIKGLPSSRFSWAPGLLAALCVYPIYLLRRTVLERHISTSWLVRYLHLTVLVIVLPVDLGVFIKAISGMF